MIDNDKERIQSVKVKFKLEFLCLWNDFSCHLVIKKQNHICDLVTKKKTLHTCVFCTFSEYGSSSVQTSDGKATTSINLNWWYCINRNSQRLGFLYLILIKNIRFDFFFKLWNSATYTCESTSWCFCGYSVRSSVLFVTEVHSIHSWN